MTSEMGSGQPIRVAHAAELARYVGHTLPPSSWMTVPQEDVGRFAALTGDDNWIHLEVARAARELAEGGTIVPGHLLLALMPALLRQIYVVEKAGDSRLAALREVRFRHAVRVGHPFRLEASFRSVRTRRAFTKIDTECRIELEDGTTALTAERTEIFRD